jgi:spore coat protein A, manganese oxidase
MKLTRRDLIKAGAMAGIYLALPRIGRGAPSLNYIDWTQIPATDYTPATPLGILTGTDDMFVDQLVLPQVILPRLAYDPVTKLDTHYYDVDITEHLHTFSSRLPAGGTPVWGYGPGLGQSVLNAPTGYLDGIILANKGTPVRINFRNLLPNVNLIPVDPSIVGYPQDANGFVHNATTVHLHGGHVPWQSDGHPLSWFGNAGGPHGSYFDPNKYTADPLAKPWEGKVSNTFWYPNDQTSRFVWYHEHAVGLTRINAYNGVASAYIMRDMVEANMAGSGALPKLGPPEIGGRELFLVLQDKSFDSNGLLWYPKAPDPATLFNPPALIPYPSCSPEMEGDVNMVNGIIWPTLSVSRVRYRVRMLNGAQTRAYRLKLYFTDDGVHPNFAKPGPTFHIFGTEGGFLPQTVKANDPAVKSSPKPIILPAERLDMIIDFSQCPLDSKLVLWNDAPTPFPAGTFPVWGLPVTTDPAYWKEGCVMRFEVNGPLAPETTVGATRVPLPNDLWPAGAGGWAAQRLNPASANVTLNYTLNEGFDDYGRLIQLIGGNTGPGIFGTPFGEAFLDGSGIPIPREQHKRGDTEIWNIYNITADTHPMHFHLVDCQILSRQAFDVAQYSANAQVKFIGPAQAPAPWERGWKDTVQCPPGMLTKIIMKIDARPEWVDPNLQPDRLAHYVWHCHILEHEEHDMMRQFDVV